MELIKHIFDPAPALFPLPTVLVSCAAEGCRPNIITLAWVGTVCAEPPLVSISMRPERHSYDLIIQSGEFVINIPTADQLAATDWCGIVSGRERDKFAESGFTAVAAEKVKAPLIAECPVNLECVTRKVLKLGVQHAIIGEIVNIQADSAVLNTDGTIDYGRVRPITLSGAEYWDLGKRIGNYGFSKNRFK